MNGKSSTGSGGPIDHDELSDDGDGPLTRGRIAVIAAVGIFGLLIASGAIQFGALTGGGTGVTIDDVEMTGQVAEGEQFDVVVTVNNTANETVSDVVEVDAGGLGIETADVDVPAETTETVTLSLETEAGDVGENQSRGYTVEVITGEDSVERTLNVVADQPEIGVEVVDTSSPVFAGQSLDVTARITNNGDEDWSGEVLLNDTGDTVTDTSDITVEAGTTEQVDLVWETEEGITGNITVVARDDLGAITSGARSVEVIAAGEPFFDVTDVSAPAVVAGEDLSVAVTVNNSGEISDLQTLRVDTEALGTKSAEVELATGDSTEETFTFETATDDGGTYNISASTDDSSQETTVTVERPGVPSLSGLELPGDGTVAKGEGGSISVEVTNDGQGDGSFDVTLAIGDSEQTESTGTLEPEDSETVKFDSVTGGLSPETYDVTVSSGDAEVTGSLAVLKEAAPALSGLDIAGEGNKGTVTLGSDAAIAVTAENIGGESGSFDVTLDISDEVTDTESTGTLGAGETETVMFDGVTSGLEEGTYSVTVSIADETVTGSLTVGQPGEANFQVISTDTQPDTVGLGEEVTISATIENIGTETGEKSVELTVETDDPVNRQQSVELGSGGTETVEFTTVIEAAAAGYPYTVSTEDGSADGVINVDASPAMFAVSIDSTDSPVTAGETLSVGATIQNTGDTQGTQTITLSGPFGSDSTEVTLPAGDSKQVTLTLDTSGVGAGEYEVTVGGNNDQASTDVVVEEGGPFFAVSILDAPGSVTEGEAIDVTVIVQNTGDASDDQTITLNGGSLGSVSTDLSLAAGASTELELTLDTSEGDSGDYSVEVDSGDDSDSTTVAVSATTFAVSIDSTNSPVTEGGTLTVTATIENTGDAAGTQTVELTGGPGTASKQVSLSPGKSTTETFNVSTSGGDAGDYTITVSSNDNSASTSVEVEQAPADSVSVATQPQDTNAGDEIGGPPAAKVTNEFGNAVSGVDVEVSANGPGSITSGTQTVSTDSTGVATFDDLVIDESGDYTLEFSAAGDTAETNEFTVSAGSADSVEVESQPQDTTAGDEIGGQPAAKVTGQNGNPVPGVDVSVSANGPGSITSGDTTVQTDGSGVATFDDLVIDESGDYTLEFSAAGDTVETSEFTVSPTLRLSRARHPDRTPSVNAMGSPGESTATESVSVF